MNYVLLVMFIMFLTFTFIDTFSWFNFNVPTQTVL